MKNFIALALLLLSFQGNTQNWRDVTNDYIINPSFEIYDVCPTGVSSPNDYQINHCTGWTTPTYATSDYFNSCNPGAVGVPYNAVGYQNAYNGVGHLGFLGYGGSFAIDSVEVGWYEYVQTELLNPLLPNRTYHFSMRVARADIGSLSHNNIGACFSQDSLRNYSTSAALNVTPTIANTTGWLADTAQWTLIKGEFIAQGGEKYLTIGWFGSNFLDDSYATQNIAVDTSTGDTLLVYESYYYVDSLILRIWDFDNNALTDNFITPNGDGINDEISFANLGLRTMCLNVYNRWGTAVFSSCDPNLIWNGRNSNGQILADGTYYYTMYGETASGISISKSQYILILN